MFNAEKIFPAAAKKFSGQSTVPELQHGTEILIAGGKSSRIISIRN
ncbi:MAG: hypothetical protein IKI08_01065 [Selenomonadaceae bacterium]|nr:hypothetical protein [Selenomonadaceae bacterium]